MPVEMKVSSIILVGCSIGENNEHYVYVATVP
jgi:hypothetical protein